MNVLFPAITSVLGLGLPQNFIYIAVGFQLLAAVGFIVMITSWFKTPPEGGLLGRHEAVLPIIVVFILIASMLWAPLTVTRINTGSIAAKVGAVVSLIATAIGSILLVAGACEETKPRWYVMIGAILFAIVTVLFDGVAYNCRFIMYH
jgi:hypothetical protein